MGRDSGNKIKPIHVRLIKTDTRGFYLGVLSKDLGSLHLGYNALLHAV